MKVSDIIEAWQEGTASLRQENKTIGWAEVSVANFRELPHTSQLTIHLYLSRVLYHCALLFSCLRLNPLR